MNIKEMFTGQEIQVSGEGYEPIGEFSTAGGKIDPGNIPDSSNC